MEGASHPAAPPLPLPSTSPPPWCLFLNYISTLASVATLFTHSFIHIHLARTCLVPVRRARRERAPPHRTVHKQMSGSRARNQAPPWDGKVAEEQLRCQGEKEGWWREEMKILGRQMRCRRRRWDAKGGSRGFGRRRDTAEFVCRRCDASHEAAVTRFQRAHMLQSLGN